MNLERISDNYTPTGPLDENEEGFFYPVKPKAKNGEFNTSILMSWDEESMQWLSFLEGTRKDESGENHFTKGPYCIGAQETIKLCRYYELPIELRNREGTIGLISMTSPELFVRIMNECKLKKTSK